MSTVFQFDAERHEYRIDGRVVPSVTQILADVLPGWQADPWYLSRGRTVHACLAMIAQGKEYALDLSGQTPEDAAKIQGKIVAGRRFLAEQVQSITAVERQMYSTTYQYAGTLDLIGLVDGRRCIIDWKSSLDKRVRWQLGGYSLLLHDGTHWGMAVELGDEGRYRLSEMYELLRAKNEFLALLTTYRARRQCGIPERKEEKEA